MQIRLRLVGAIVAAACATSGAHAAVNLVNNGDFETGDLTGWVQTGDTLFSGVTCGSGIGANGSNCAAFFGTLGDSTGLSQTLNGLTVNDTYAVSFAFKDSSLAPTSISAVFGGQTLLSKSFAVDPSSDYVDYTFNIKAAASTQTLSFNFTDDQDFVQLDSVKVSAVPEPDSLAMVVAGLAGVGFLRRRRSAAAQSGLGRA